MKIPSCRWDITASSNQLSSRFVGQIWGGTGSASRLFSIDRQKSEGQFTRPTAWKRHTSPCARSSKPGAHSPIRNRHWSCCSWRFPRPRKSGPSRFRTGEKRSTTSPILWPERMPAARRRSPNESSNRFYRDGQGRGTAPFPSPKANSWSFPQRHTTPIF